MIIRAGRLYKYGKQIVLINRIIAIDTDDNMIIANCNLRDDLSINMSMKIDELRVVK